MNAFQSLAILEMYVRGCWLELDHGNIAATSPERTVLVIFSERWSGCRIRKDEALAALESCASSSVLLHPFDVPKSLQLINCYSPLGERLEFDYLLFVAPYPACPDMVCLLISKKTLHIR